MQLWIEKATSPFPLWSAFIVMGPFGKFHRDRHNASPLDSIRHWMIKVPGKTLEWDSWFPWQLLAQPCMHASFFTRRCVFVYYWHNLPVPQWLHKCHLHLPLWGHSVLRWTPTTSWWGCKHKIRWARKYSPSSPRLRLFCQRNDGDLWGRWRGCFRTHRIRHHLGSCTESQTGLESWCWRTGPQKHIRVAVPWGCPWAERVDRNSRNPDLGCRPLPGQVVLSTWGMIVWIKMCQTWEIRMTVK